MKQVCRKPEFLLSSPHALREQLRNKDVNKSLNTEFYSVHPAPGSLLKKATGIPEAKYQPEHDNNHLTRPEASFVEKSSHPACHKYYYPT